MPRKLLTDAERRAREMTEAALQRRVVYRARKAGWRVIHFHASIVGGTEENPIFATAVSGDARGVPDLILVKAGRKPIWAELKRELEHPAPHQWAWLDLLIAAEQVVCVWRPSDLPAIERILRQ